MAKKKKIIIMGAAGRDFHNFNTVYRNCESCEIVAFTAAQIPDINDRKYPAELAGPLYPKGIPIYDEADLPKLIKEHKIDEVVFAYSDVTYKYVMNRSALVNALGRYQGTVFLAPMARGNLQIHWPEGNVIVVRGRVDALSGVPDYTTRVMIERGTA